LELSSTTTGAGVPVILHVGISLLSGRNPRLGMYGILRLELREPTKSLPDAGIGSVHSEG
jgi:hypothetical protein